jgi:DNA processing protein
MHTQAPAPAVDWLRLWRLVQQSAPSTQKLLRHFESPTRALAASPVEWRALGVAPARAERLASWQYGDAPDLDRELDEGVAADLAWCEAPGQSLLAIDSPDYPALLREIPDPPPLLFLKGDPALLYLPQIAVVGSRHPSLTGKSDAEAFAGELARAGLLINSGMARGIDAAAHVGALRAGCKTLAVLGTGADRPYPRENTKLYQSIVNNGGLIVSEFLPGTLPLALHFPRRNRVISGLSLGVLVVEAAPESGSLITARLAAEQGRMVWALPGSRHNVQAQGCLKLIREGVSAVTEVGQILADLPPMLGLLYEQLNTPVAPAKPVLDQELKLVLSALSQEPRHADWVISATGQPPAQVLRALSRLEVAGLIAAVPGGYERLP